MRSLRFELELEEKLGTFFSFFFLSFFAFFNYTRARRESLLWMIRFAKYPFSFSFLLSVLQTRVLFFIILAGLFPLQHGIPT